MFVATNKTFKFLHANLEKALRKKVLFAHLNALGKYIYICVAPTYLCRAL